MKRAFFLLLVLVIILAPCAAPAESGFFPVPEAARPFDNVWVNGNYHLNVYAQDGGFIIEVEKNEHPDKGEGFIWEYLSNYQEKDNTLVTFSALKWPAAFADGNAQEGEIPVYVDGAAVFSLNDKGQLLWNDMKEHEADGIVFDAIGRFEGIWPGTGSSAELLWADDHYTAYVDVQNDKGEVESYLYNAVYNRDKNILEAMGTCDIITYVNNEEVSRIHGEDACLATFSINEEHRLVWENQRSGGVPRYVFQNQNETPADSNG